MVRIRTLAAMAVLSATITGCAATQELRVANNPSLDSVHQPVVQKAVYALDLATTGGGLGAYEVGRLRGWFDSLQLAYGDQISIDAGQYSADAEITQAVGAVAASYGMLLTDGAPVTSGAVQPGSIRIIVSRSSATVPGCPDWSHANAIGTPVSTDSNYGCAINSNLAAMIADPNDLLLGRVSSGGDSNAASKPVKTYRDRAVGGAAKTEGGK